jgi:histidine triad (HIT) family protein
MGCLFCKIGFKEISSKVIEETENFLGFLDINPCSIGHTVIIPKNHYENFLEMPKNLGEEFIEICQKIIKKLSRGLKTDHFTIGINEGKLAGRAIDHLHVHIIPRFENDSGGSIHSVVRNKPKETIDEIAQLINSD